MSTVRLSLNTAGSFYDCADFNLNLLKARRSGNLAPCEWQA